MERRKHERLWVQLRCVIHSPGLPMNQAETVIENISRGGMSILWPGASGLEAPREGSVVEVRIDLPQTLQFGKRFLQCTGEVTRIALADNGKWSVALRTRNMRMRSDKRASREVAAMVVM